MSVLIIHSRSQNLPKTWLKWKPNLQRNQKHDTNLSIYTIHTRIGFVSFAHALPLHVIYHIRWLFIIRLLGQSLDVVGRAKLNEEMNKPVCHQVMNGVKPFLSDIMFSVIVKLEILCLVIKSVFRKEKKKKLNATLWLNDSFKNKTKKNKTGETLYVSSSSVFILKKKKKRLS